MVLTQEEAESSVLCEDTSVAHPKVDVIALSNSSQSNSKHFKNIAKGTTDPRVEFLSQVQTQILIKFHLQNLDQASSSKSQPNISLSIKLELQNLDQT